VIDGGCSLNERLDYGLNVVTKIRVEITFDPDKDAANFAKQREVKSYVENAI
jgi:hypothetical protein